VPLPPREPLLEDMGSQATAVLEVPPGAWQDEPPAMYRAMHHRLPLLNGFSGYTPPHYLALAAGLLAHDGDTLEAIAETGAVALLLHGERDPDGTFARFLESRPILRERARSGTRRLFVMRHRVVAAPPDGVAVGIAKLRASHQDERTHLMTDGDITSRWTADLPQCGQEVVEVELEGERELSTVVLSVGPFREDYPRRLVIETSRDGREWTEAWQGAGFAPAMRAGLRSPRAMPVRFDFEPRRARRLRLRQTGSDRVMWWSIAELEVLGPSAQPAEARAGWQAGHQ
jgi:F5/8 type C domain